MKEIKEQTQLDVSQLVEECVYFNSKHELVQIKKIDTQKRQLNFFNISLGINMYYMSLDRHTLVRKVR